ncbi:uncharacterized protein B0H18DRAFT_1008884 [Fomitopsis serialis]|uniref:uncharacterized protein n=1 Tax=Fomitopsis serialis TaxID=139415 RepID=UPI00200843ED|nr:uncharacterized protein B0H18DRAFT_1008884 [Neoantrodia serialis]KAH9925536.1 hypothetical protein B0H18DRAFT_1008884 [Neoantrodia serialis]
MPQRQQSALEAASSTSSSAASSPHAHPDSPPSEGTDEPTDTTASTGIPHRDSTRDSREKRKRSRVTPEQLTQLETFFAANRSPTAARRKEISDMLGMTERQTQIWFQNRRAKAKLQASNRGRPSTAPSPDIPPILNFADDPQLRGRIHEDGPVRLISCTDLAIGTWRRIATLQDRYDLLAYVCEAKQCVAWYVQCDGTGFKMEIPFGTITDVTIDGVSPGMAMVCLRLSRPPSFFLESRPALGADASATRFWKPCSDWTEDRQASKMLQHELRYQLGRHAVHGFTAQPYTYPDEQVTFDPVPAVHAPVPVAGHMGMYQPPRTDYASGHHPMQPTMLARRASEASLTTHSPAPWDSPPIQPTSSQQYVSMHHGPPDPMRLPALAASPPASIDTLNPFMSGYYGELQGLPQRDSESYNSLSSGPASSSSTGQSSFDLPSPPNTVDMGGPRQRWGEPVLVEPQSLYDAQGYDQMRGQIHMGTHMGTDMPPYGYDPSGSMPDKHYG